MNMVNAMPLRVHLSGQIDRLSPEQMALVKEGIAVMKKIRCDTAHAIPFYPTGLPTYRDKIFSVAYAAPSCTRVAVWRLDTEEDTLTLPVDCRAARVLYPASFDGTLFIENGSVTVKMPRKNTAVLIELA